MNNRLFDYDTQANNALLGGASADAALGMAGRPGLSIPPVTASPLAARATQMRAENDRMLAELQAQRTQAAPREPLLGYNAQTKEVFSGGQTFALDVGPGLKALQAGLLDTDNRQLPPGFVPVPAGQVRKRLADMYDRLGFVDSIQRRVGQGMQNFGSTIRDVTGDTFGQGLEDAGTQIVDNNPQRVTTPGQIAESPWQFTKESVGQVVPDIAANIGVTAGGAALGAKVGAAVAPFLGPLAPAAPVAGAVVGGGLARFGLIAPETYGSVRREQREQGIDDPFRAATAAAGSAALESVLEPGGRVGRVLGTLGRKVEQKSAKDLLATPITAKTVAKDVGLSALGEAATEIPQSAVERWGAFKPLDTPEAIDEYIMSGAAGAVGGGAFGPLHTLGRAAEQRQARNLLAQKDAEAQALAAAQAQQVVAQQVAGNQRADQEEQAFRERTLQGWQQFGPQLNDIRSDQMIMAEENPELYRDWRETQLNAYAGDPSLVSNLEDRPGGPLPPTNRLPPPVWRKPTDPQNRPVSLQAVVSDPSAADVLQPAPEQSGAGLSEPSQPPAAPAVVSTPQAQEKPSPEGAAANELFDEIAKELKATKLDATVIGGMREVTGKLSRPMRVIAAIAKALRSNRGAEAIVRKKGSVDVDTGLQAKFQDDLTNILAAAREVISAADSMANIESSRLPSSKRTSGKKIAGQFDIDPRDPEYDDQVAQAKAFNTVNDLTTARTRLALAVDEFVRVAGSEKNAQAVVAAFKTLVQGQSTTRVNNNAARALERARAKAEGDTVDATRFKGERAMDALLSGAWARYKEGTLNTAEQMDVVRSTPIRSSKEDAGHGATPPLVEAHDDGHFGHPSNKSKSEQEKAGLLQKGALGVLEYLKGHGTLFERTLSTAIGTALKRLPADKRPTIKWLQVGDKTKSHYDPKTRTIAIHVEESPEVILHEYLHAALQWYVYTEPNNTDVKALMKSVEALVNYKGEVPAKAKEVIDVLRKIVNRKTNKETAQLDAVLELISYGTTLRDFKEFLKTLPQVTSSADKDASWFVNASKTLWKQISALLQRMLGTTNSMARDVLERSVALLEAAADPEGPAPPDGAAKGSTTLKNEAGAKRGPLSRPDELRAKLAQIEGERWANDKATAARPYGFDYIVEKYNEALGYLDSYPDSTVRELMQALDGDGAIILYGADGYNRYSVQADGSLRPLQESFPSKEKFALAQKLLSGGTFDPASGNILEAQVTSSAYPTPQSTTPVLAANDLQRYTKHVIPSYISSQFLFGHWWGKTVVPGVTALSDKAVAKLDNDAPALMRWMRWFSSRLGFSTELSSFYEGYKNDLQGGGKVTELVARELYNEVLRTSTPHAMELMQYLDGDKTKLADNAPLREKADHLLRRRADYIALLPPAERDFFSNLKFSEGMVFATDTSKLASRSVGASKLRELAAEATINELGSNLDVRWMHTDKAGSPTVGGRYYSVQIDVNGKTTHSYFVAEDKVAQWQSDPVIQASGGMMDKTKVWQVGTTRRDGKIPFRAVRTLGDALKDDPKAVADAIRNTMAILAANHASREFTTSLWGYGRENGAADARAIAFSSVEEIKKVYGRAPADGTVTDVNDQDAKSSKVRGNLRSRNQWIKLPGTPKYGALAGKIIRGDVWAAVEDMQNTHPLGSFWATEAAMRTFKKAKTVYNPGTHVTNLATNVTLMMMHDIPVRSLVDASRLLWNYSRDPKSMAKEDRQLLLQFIDSNAMLGDFASTELKRDIYDAVNASLKKNESGAASRAFTRVADYIGVLSTYEAHKSEIFKAARAANKLDDVVTSVYAAEDNMFRLAAFLTKAGEYAAAHDGKFDAAGAKFAGDFAKHAFLDYNTDAVAVKALRQSVLPFVSWTYAIIPLLGQIALHKPWKLINLYVGYMMIEQAMRAASGDSDDEDERKRKAGPQWARDRLLLGFGPYSHIRVPFMGTDEAPVYYKLGGYIPLSSFGERVPNAFMGISGWPSPVTPGGPFVAPVLALMGGVDPYTGKPLAPPTASSLENAAARLRVVANTFAPNVPFLNSADSAKLEAILRDKRGMSGAELSNLQIARWGGLKLYDYNIGDSLVQQAIAQKAIKRDFEQEIARLRRAEARFETPDWESFSKRRAELLDRMKERMAEARGEE